MSCFQLLLLLGWVRSQWRRQEGPLVEVSVEGAPVPAYPLRFNASCWRALLPTTPLDEPGTISIRVQVLDGRHRPFEGRMLLHERGYPTESIWLPEHKQGLAATALEKEALAEALAVHSPEQLWQLPLQQPSQGGVSTEYGLQRFYNGKFAKGYYHRGVDYAAPAGDPVTAPAGGKVSLVGRETDGFALHGNCVAVDHGQGVASLMMHLHTVCVSAGALVQAGQPLGTVGSTGMATGPHLHWGLYVHGLCVDPDPWLHQQSWA